MCSTMDATIPGSDISCNASYSEAAAFALYHMQHVNLEADY